MCHQGGGGAGGASGVAARDDARAGSRQQRQAQGGATRELLKRRVRTTRTTCAISRKRVRMYKMFVFVFEVRLFDSGREVAGGRCGPAVAERAVPFDRK
jgi:hypothetical protein